MQSPNPVECRPLLIPTKTNLTYKRPKEVCNSDLVLILIKKFQSILFLLNIRMKV